MRVQALFSVLSRKFKDNEILFVDSLQPVEIKTSLAEEIVKNLTKAGGWAPIYKPQKPRILAALSEKNNKTEKSFRNLSALQIALLRNLNPMEVLNYKYLLIENPGESVKFLESRN